MGKRKSAAVPKDLADFKSSLSKDVTRSLECGLKSIRKKASDGKSSNDDDPVTLLPVQSALITEMYTGDTIRQRSNSRRDVSIISPTGSGKTLAYLIPLMSELSAGVGLLQCIIVVPTHDLRNQVLDEARRFLPNHRVAGDTKDSVAQASVLVLTPGRLVDVLPRVSPDHLRFLIFDEADRLITESYFGWLRELEAWMPAPAPHTGAHMLETRVRRLIVSATLTKGHIDRFRLHLPLMIKPQGDMAIPGTITETVIECAVDEEKMEAIEWLVKEREYLPCLVICGTKDTTINLSRALQETAGQGACDVVNCIETSALSGRDIKPNTVLVSTDVATRGVDLNLSSVIQFDAPTNVATYVHRVGRTGRAYREGAAITLATSAGVRGLRGVLNKVSRSREIKWQRWNEEEEEEDSGAE